MIYKTRNFERNAINYLLSAISNKNKEVTLLANCVLKAYSAYRMYSAYSVLSSIASSIWHLRMDRASRKVRLNSPIPQITFENIHTNRDFDSLMNGQNNEAARAIFHSFARDWLKNNHNYDFVTISYEPIEFQQENFIKRYKTEHVQIWLGEEQSQYIELFAELRINTQTNVASLWVSEGPLLPEIPLN